MSTTIESIVDEEVTPSVSNVSTMSVSMSNGSNEVEPFDDMVTDSDSDLEDESTNPVAINQPNVHQRTHQSADAGHKKATTPPQPKQRRQRPSPKKHDPNGPTHVERKKIVLKKREVDYFDVLPEGWIEVTHFSGMPVYLHKSTRVCTMSKPYYLGPGSTRKHHIPITAIPCLSYKKEIEKELKQKQLQRQKVIDTLAVDTSTIADCSIVGTTNPMGGHGFGTNNNDSIDCNRVERIKGSKNDEDGDGGKDKDIIVTEPVPGGSNVSVTINDGDDDGQDRNEVMKGMKRRNIDDGQMVSVDCSIDLQLVPGTGSSETSHSGSITSHCHSTVTGSSSTGSTAAQCPVTMSGQCPPPNKKSKLKESGSNVSIKSSELKLRTPIGSVKVESIEESRKKNSLNWLQLREYAGKVFEFQEITIKKFKTWKDRRAHITARKIQERPSLPQGTKLITCPLVNPNGGEGVGRNYKKEFVMNPAGKSKICILHEFIQHTERVQPKYEFCDLENVTTPYSATVIIRDKDGNDIKYGTGYGASKKQAKLAAAHETLKILIPDYVAQEEQVQRNKPATITINLQSAAADPVGGDSSHGKGDTCCSHKQQRPQQESVAAVENPPLIEYRKKSDRSKSAKDNSSRRDMDGSRRDIDSSRRAKDDGRREKDTSADGRRDKESSNRLPGSSTEPIQVETNVHHNLSPVECINDGTSPIVAVITPSSNELVNDHSHPAINEQCQPCPISVTTAAAATVDTIHGTSCQETLPTAEQRTLIAATEIPRTSPVEPTIVPLPSETDVPRVSKSRYISSSFPGHETQEGIFAYFDNYKITNEKIADHCAMVGQPSPYGILVECLKRNHGLGETDIDFKEKLPEDGQVVTKSNKGMNTFVMKAGKHFTEVRALKKKVAKQRAAQEILQKIHPQIKTFGGLLRLYGGKSCLTPKEKKEEERKITELQSAACPNRPNHAILNKLREEMVKLHDIKTLDLLEMDTVPSANLEHVDL